jgi:gas vesicle protein GvpL/GvpF
MKVGESATYLYCAVRARRCPRLRPGRRGLPAAGAPRPIGAGPELWLIVSTVPSTHYGVAPIERRLQDLDWVSRCAMAHEAVVEDAARSGPVIPMKLFTLFANDDRAVAHVARRRKMLARLFELVAGRQEWAVRVSIDERATVRLRASGARRVATTSGTAFLVGKKAEKDAARLAVESAVREGERIFNELAGVATDARRRTPVPSNTTIRVVLDAAFLLPAKQAREFRAAVARHAKACRARGCDLTLTGPWPPYNFVSETA